jgi:hypothetical protein
VSLTGWIRGGLLVVGLPQAFIGVWAYAAPRHFFDHFPSAAEPWLPFFGPFDEHLVADFGALSAALSLILVAAAVRWDAAVARAGLWAWLVWSTPHFATHARLSDLMSPQAASSNLVSTTLAVVLPLLLLWMIRRAPAWRPVTETAS